VDCPTDVCAVRDPKGLYEKAKAGIIKEFTGISAPYEAPENPELVMHSDRIGPMEAAEMVLEILRERQILSP